MTKKTKSKIDPDPDAPFAAPFDWAAYTKRVNEQAAVYEESARDPDEDPLVLDKWKVTGPLVAAPIGIMRDAGVSYGVWCSHCGVSARVIVSYAEIATIACGALPREWVACYPAAQPDLQCPRCGRKESLGTETSVRVTPSEARLTLFMARSDSKIGRAALYGYLLMGFFRRLFGKRICLTRKR